MRAAYFNNAGDDRGVGPFNILSFQNKNECKDDIPVNNRDNQFIPPIAGSRRSIDPFTSLAPILTSNMVALSFLISSDSNDNSVGKLFTEKNELILQLRKVAFRDKFNFQDCTIYNDKFQSSLLFGII